MAMIYTFTCPGCAHEVDSSGEPSTYMFACSTPILCRTCGEIRSATTHSDKLGNFPPGKGRAAPLKCPENPRHKVVKWAPKYGCPKCGKGMKQSEYPTYASD